MSNFSCLKASACQTLKNGSQIFLGHDNLLAIRFPLVKIIYLVIDGILKWLEEQNNQQ